MNTHDICDTTNPFLRASGDVLGPLRIQAPWLFDDPDAPVKRPRSQSKACPAPAGDAATIGRTRGDDHVTWHGDWPAEVRALAIRLSKASNAESKRWPVSTLATWGDALDGPLTNHEAYATKGGQGFTQGEVRNGGQRLAANMVALYAVSLDIESGDAEADVRKRLQELDWCAVTYSTFSHGKTETTIPDDVILKFSGVAIPAAVTEDHVRRFLVEKKGMRPSAVADITVAPGPKKERIVNHPPIDRFRVVIPLAQPFIVVDHGETASQAADVWSAFYRGVAKTLDVLHDQSCEDLSRFMWAPEHKKGSDNYFVNVIGGRALAWDEITPVPIEKTGKQTAKKTGTNAPKSFDLPWLPKWWAKYANRFRAADFFAAYYDERGSGSEGKVTTECPFDGLHSDPGNSDDKGFFARNWNDAKEGEDGEGRAYCRCSHTHGAIGEHSTLDYIGEACHAHGITDWRDFEKFVDVMEGDGPYSLDEYVEAFKDFDAAFAAAHAVPDSDLKAAGIVAHRLGFSGFTPSENATIKQLLCAKRIKLAASTFNAELKRGQSARPVAKVKGDKPTWCPHGVMLKDDAFWTVRLTTGQDGHSYEAPDKHVCNVFEPVARVTDADGQPQGLRIEHKGAETSISIASLHSAKEQLATTLSTRHGLNCGTTRAAYDSLTELLRCASLKADLPAVVEVAQPGWHFDGAVFVCANGKALGKAPGGSAVYLAEGSGYKERAPDGVGDAALESAMYARIWQDGPDLWRFGDLIGLSSACLEVVGCRSGGFALDGTTRHGKTTTQYVQMGRAGSPDEGAGRGGLIPFNPSPEAAEIPLRNATSNPFAMDELQNVKDPRELQRFIFAMAGGSGKVRMKRSADAMRETHTWKALTTISTERTISDVLKGAGRAMVGGLVARYPSLSVTGLCDHSAANGALAQEIKRTLFTNYGHTFSWFVERALIGINRIEAAKEWRALCSDLVADGPEHLKAPAEFFALAWWAGRQAVRIGLTEGMTEEKVASTVKAAWDAFAGRDEGKALKAGGVELESVLEYLTTRKGQTIVKIEKAQEGIGYQEWAGCYDAHTYYLRATKMDEICGGTGARPAVLKALQEAGMLILPKTADGAKTFTSIPCLSGKVKHYRLKATMVEEAEAEEEQDDLIADDTVDRRLREALHEVRA